MAIDADYIKTAFPEFAASSFDSRIAFWLGQVDSHVNAESYGARGDLAQALWVAHMIKLGEMRGVGAVTSEKIGDIQRSYAAPGAGAARSAGSYGQTAYGTQFAAMVRFPRGPLVT